MFVSSKRGTKKSCNHDLKLPMRQPLRRGGLYLSIFVEVIILLNICNSILPAVLFLV